MPFGRPFRAISLCVSFPGLKPWAVFCSPVGRLELAQENVQLQRHFVPGYDRCRPYGTRLQTFRRRPGRKHFRSAVCFHESL